MEKLESSSAKQPEFKSSRSIREIADQRMIKHQRSEILRLNQEIERLNKRFEEHRTDNENLFRVWKEEKERKWSREVEILVEKNRRLKEERDEFRDELRARENGWFWAVLTPPQIYFGPFQGHQLIHKGKSIKAVFLETRHQRSESIKLQVVDARNDHKKFWKRWSQKLFCGFSNSVILLNWLICRWCKCRRRRDFNSVV